MCTLSHRNMRFDTGPHPHTHKIATGCPSPNLSLPRTPTYNCNHLLNLSPPSLSLLPLCAPLPHFPFPPERDAAERDRNTIIYHPFSLIRSFNNILGLTFTVCVLEKKRKWRLLNVHSVSELWPCLPLSFSPFLSPLLLKLQLLPLLLLATGHQLIKG